MVDRLDFGKEEVTAEEIKREKQILEEKAVAAEAPTPEEEAEAARQAALRPRRRIDREKLRRMFAPRRSFLADVVGTSKKVLRESEKGIGEAKKTYKELETEAKETWKSLTDWGDIMGEKDKKGKVSKEEWDIWGSEKKDRKKKTKEKWSDLKGGLEW